MELNRRRNTLGKTIYCPFMFMDYKEKKGRRCIHCERGEITFGDERELKDYIGLYCGSIDNWPSCSLADSATRYYERTEENK